MGAVSHKKQRENFWLAMQKENVNVYKTGEMIKESKHLKQWRNRSILLIEKFIITFEGGSKIPTAVIPLQLLRSLVKEQMNIYFALKVITKDEEQYRFRSTIQSQRDEWFQNIKLQKLRLMKESKLTTSVIQEGQRLTFEEVSPDRV